MKHEEMKWVSYDGLPLFAQRWEPDGEVKGVINLVHGLGEHSGRYAHWADRFNNAGYALVSFDLRGHGRSGGQRGDTPSYNHFADDISIMLEKTEEIFPGIPAFIYGHSLGGMLVLYYLIQRQPVLKGAVVTSPGLRTMIDQQKIKIAAVKILGSLLPKVSIPNGLELEGLARDERVIEEYQNDSLVHDRVSLRMGKGMIETIEFIFENAAKINIPLLLMHGSGDRLTYAAGSEEISALVKEDCTLKIWDCYYHELHNEPEKDDVFKFLIEWVNSTNQ